MSQLSRYRKLSTPILLDKQGHLYKSRVFRLSPHIVGTFEHILGEQERLDHLATKYYRQPRKWWRICDANPEFLSPLALIGAEPLVTDEFPLVFADVKIIPEANDLLRQLAQLNGVERVTLASTVDIVSEIRQITPAEQVQVQVEHFQWIIIVTYNTVLLTTAQISAIITAAGFSLQPPEPVRRTGKRIIIPPDLSG